MNKKLKILHLEDTPFDVEMVGRVLKKGNIDFDRIVVDNKKDFEKALLENPPDVVLSDHSLASFDSMGALIMVKKIAPATAFILVTATVSEEFAVNIIKLGADDYVLKDRMTRLPAAIEQALSQRKAQKEISDYRFALNESAIVAITDQKGSILYANENFCRISKYDVEELLGQDHRIINSGYHPPSYIKELWVTIANGNIWHGEFCNRAKDGSVYWVDTTIVPFLDAKGKPYQYLSIRTDITNRKKIEEQLKISEQKYRTIFLKSPLPNWIFDMETLRFLDVNEAASKHYGYTREEFLNMTIKDVRPGEDVKELLDEIGKIKSNIDTRHGTWRHRKKNGEIIIVETTAHAIDFNHRKARMVVVNDITERQKAEQQKEFDANNQKALINNTNDLMWSVDMDFNLITCNDSFTKVIELSTGKPVERGTNILSTQFTAAERKRYKVFYERALSGETFTITDHFEVPFDLWCEISFYPIRHKNEVVGTACFSRDITERKKAEENLKLLEKKVLEQKIQEQKKIARAIIKAEEKERNHIGRELHDNINQILAGTKLYLGIAGKKDKAIKELVQYPMDLIDSSIQEIRLLCSKMVTPLKNIDLKEMVGDLLSKLDQTTVTKTAFNFTLTNKVISDDLKLNIYRIIQEHINNIIKYAEAKNVIVSITGEDGAIDIVVSDDGKGFDVEKKRNGIGISNMINRVESFNGEITIESAVGKGSRTNIRVPY